MEKKHTSKQSKKQQQKEEVRRGSKGPHFVLKRNGTMNYDEDELMEYLRKDFGNIYQGANNEIRLTNAYGFVQNTIDLDDLELVEEDEKEASGNDSFRERMFRGTTKSQVQIQVKPIQYEMTGKQLKQQNARIFKWKEMLESFPDKIHDRLKHRARKGIPDPIRGYAWITLAQIHKQYKGDKSEQFKALVQQYGDKKNIITIFKDISRTFTHHIYFKDRFGKGQETLFRVLKALSIEHADVGYVQGMGYMAGVLLTYMDQEDAFFTMLALFRDYDILDMYRHGMPGLAKAFYVHLTLFKKYLPKLHAHMLSQNYLPSMYGSQWFMTVFAVNLPFECTIRVWDVMFAEGKKIMYRVALAIFKINQERLMTCDLDGIFTTIREYSQHCDAELLIKTALSFTFSKKTVQKLEEEFVTNPNKEFEKYYTMF